MQNSQWNEFIDSLGAEERRIVTTSAEHFSDIAAKFGSRILEKQEAIDGKLDQVLAGQDGLRVEVARQTAALEGLQATVDEHDRLIARLAERITRLEQRERASGEA